MKPTLLLSFGIAYAATSPLAYTLQRYARYCHGGYTKELKFLHLVSKPSTNPTLKDRLNSYRDFVLSNTWENHKSHQGHRMNLTQDLSPLKDFSLKHFDRLTSPPYTLKNYINFYYALWEHVKPLGYKAVADFSKIHPPQIDRFLPLFDKLHHHFNLKGIIIVRDPVRTAFGQHLCHAKRSRHREVRTYADDLDYISFFDRIKELIPDSHMVIMEELWEGDGKEKDKLSNFLDHPITDLWDNCYAPDKGHLAQYNPNVPCQFFGQTDAELTPELYFKYKQDLQKCYTNWERRFGILPRYWGRPIDYQKNASIVYG